MYSHIFSRKVRHISRVRLPLFLYRCEALQKTGTDKMVNRMKENIRKDTKAADQTIRENSRAISYDRWKKRLSRLSAEEQAHIAKKYYGGHYPWKVG